MSTLLFAIIAGLIVLHLLLQARRHGQVAPAVVARDVGLGAAVLYVVIEGSDFWLRYAWWRELGQVQTFWQFLRIRWLPQTVMAVLAAVVLVIAFRVGRRRCHTAMARTSLFSLAGHVGAIVLGVLLSVNIIDPWTIALYLGAQNTGAYVDPIFHKDLAFYFFRLPLYEMVFGWVAAMAVAAWVVVAVTQWAGSSAVRLQEMRARVVAQMEGRGYAVPVGEAAAPGQSWSGLIRVGAIVLLGLFAVAQFFARYGLLYSSHRFLTGADFVDARVGIPMIWLQIAGALVLMALIAAGRRLPGRRPAGPRLYGAGAHSFSEYLPTDLPAWLAPAVLIGFLGLAIAPGLIEALVRSAYVSPNELTLERPYIQDHIQATRMAFNLAQTSHEEVFTPRVTDVLDLSQFPDTASNIRLWDEGPFQNDITQLQALRPYYSFPSVSVDRYPIGGQTRQVLIAPRGLDTSLLPATAQSWVNLSLQYTHGYGAVLAQVDQATAEGQPRLLVQDAPPVSAVPDLKITRPGIYFGEDTTRPVFVDTRQPEFDYPKGDDNAYTTYTGHAGIVLSTPLLRLAAAVQQNATNVLLTSYFTPQTRLLLHRQILDRVQTLAPFLTIDPSPYLVVDAHGHLFWMLDAYTTSDLHPYAQPEMLGDQEVNYIRNSVKITVDAYNGTVHMYVFDNQDPILRAYRNVFPQLFLPRSAMPTDLLAHIRYPKAIFELQAQIYRIYHMQDPQVFYNKEDQWDIARQLTTQEETKPTSPYYVMLRLPGDQQAEFVLLVPFTSHNRDNLIAWVAARCDPAHYGQIIFYRLPKEQLVYGPLQIESRVDQNRTISKDLSLWNQQGSRVIRGTTLVLPVDGTFLYVEPIFIQAPQAKLPELKKIVLAVGNRLVYADDLDSAIAELAQAPQLAATAGATGAAAPAAVTMPASTAAVPRALLQQIESHLARYRSLTAQGQFAQAGAELQAAEDALQRALQPPAKH